MRRLATALLVLAVMLTGTLLSGCGKGEPAAPAAPAAPPGASRWQGGKAPPGTALAEADLVPTLKATGAKLVVGTVWGPLCGSCIEEAVALVDKIEPWRERGVAVIGLGYTDDKADGEEFLESTGGRAKHPLYIAKWAFERYGCTSTPTLIVFKPSGEVLFKTDHEVSEHPLADLEKKLDELAK